MQPGISVFVHWCMTNAVVVDVLVSCRCVMNTDVADVSVLTNNDATMQRCSFGENMTALLVDR